MGRCGYLSQTLRRPISSVPWLLEAGSHPTRQHRHGTFSPEQEAYQQPTMLLQDLPASAHEVAPSLSCGTLLVSHSLAEFFHPSCLSPFFLLLLLLRWLGWAVVSPTRASHLRCGAHTPDWLQCSKDCTPCCGVPRTKLQSCRTILSACGWHRTWHPCPHADMADTFVTEPSLGRHLLSLIVSLPMLQMHSWPECVCVCGGGWVRDTTHGFRISPSALCSQNQSRNSWSSNTHVIFCSCP